MEKRFFADLANKRLRRAAFQNVKQLETIIAAYVEDHNNHSQGLQRTATASAILEKVPRTKATLNKITSERRSSLDYGNYPTSAPEIFGRRHQIQTDPLLANGRGQLSRPFKECWQPGPKPRGLRLPCPAWREQFSRGGRREETHSEPHGRAVAEGIALPQFLKRPLP